MHEYSQADLTRLLRVSASVVSALVLASYITPAAHEGKTNYSFQDLLILRTASAMSAAKISVAKIVSAIGHMRATLPPGSLLTTLALAAAGEGSVVQGDQQWEPHPGQLPLGPHDSASGTVSTLHPAPPRPPAHLQAAAHYARGHSLEDTDVGAARAAYLDALNAHSDHLDARINLGRLLHLDGELKGGGKGVSRCQEFECAAVFQPRDITRRPKSRGRGDRCLSRGPGAGSFTA